MGHGGWGLLGEQEDLTSTLQHPGVQGTRLQHGEVILLWIL